MSDVPSSIGTLLAGFSTTAAALVHGPGGLTAYTYKDEGSGLATAPIVDLTSAEPSVYTDCNGWVNYALNTVAPLHFAVLAASHDSAQFDVKVTGINKHGHTVTKQIDEAQQPFARAFVLAHDFAAEPLVGSAADGDGFAQVGDFRTLQAGDVIAYALGVYSDLQATGLPYPTDTGHTMVVTAAPVLVDTSQWTAAETSALAALDTDDQQVAAVYAVSLVDSSSVPHLSQDNVPAGAVSDDRTYGQAATDAANAVAPAVAGTVKAGGLGTGSMLFAVDASGKPIGFAFDLGNSWHPTPASGGSPAQGALIAAARLTDTIDLSALPASALTDGRLEVTLMPDRATVLGGQSYAAAEHVVGAGGLLVDGQGTLTLSTANTFTGGIVLDGVTLHLAAAGAAGSGQIETEAGTRNLIRSDAGAITVDSQGSDTVEAGGGSATIRGGTGSVFIGGAAGENLMQATGQSTLWGGGAGDWLQGGHDDLIGAASSGNTTLVGGQRDILLDGDGTLAFTGSAATVFGAAAGSDVVVGTGDFTMVGRGGQTTLFGGGGDGVAWAGASRLVDVAGSGAGTLVAGSGQSALWINNAAGAQTVMAVDGAGGGSVTVLGFRAGIDRFQSSGYTSGATQAMEGGSLVVTLSDHTTITFAGVSSLG